MLLAALALVLLCGQPAAGQILDKRRVLERQAFRDNRDVDWFAARIPVIESPDADIDATYYYRWELVTKHLTYGSPETGYTLTEFIDRPFWSGAYGAISCPLGHQLDEIRWLHDRHIVHDFSRYWFETPGAQPRSYSNWYGAAVWGAFQVSGDTAYLRRMLPHMKAQYAGWMAERWDAAHRMFRWDGLHDGMERNINSRQTDDIDAGAVGYRPTLNSYLFGDARAIARASALFGDTTTARAFDARADSLRARVQAELWDERRRFFLHQWAADDRDGTRALTRTYESGKFAGSPHGREQIGFIPWQFHLPEAGKGFERAWAFLMDTAYFRAPCGPRTTERHDPQFLVSPRCCWWSGNSWPYATSQTLVAMANLLNDYRQAVVTRQDWFDLFRTFTQTHRKEGRPYVAEAAHPYTGSWSGHDTPYHSEHYFHSQYVNLVITGLAGLRPRADDTLEVHPMLPASWDHFALDDVRYHGRRVSVLWDHDGTRYRRGRGFMVLLDGRVVARADQPGRLVAHIGPPRVPTLRPAPVNLAVNNGRGAWPRVEASFAAPEHPPEYLVDGNYWYHREPPNRWTNGGSPNARDTVTVDFGVDRLVERVTLYPLGDSWRLRRDARTVVLPTSEVVFAIAPPAAVDVQLLRDGRWVSPRRPRREPSRPAARRANTISFRARRASAVRVVLTRSDSAFTGLSELEVWGPPQPLPPATRAPRNLAYGGPDGGRARASASFTGTGDRVEQVNDGQVAFTKYSRNRWTAYRSPNASDWVEVDFGAPTAVGTVELYLFGDDGGVKAPRAYTVQIWDGARWRDATVVSRTPGMPLASARNVVRLAPVTTSRIRVVLEHALPAFSGISELVVLGP